MEQRRMGDKSVLTIEDPNIVSRVKTYLEENIDKTYIDVAEMANSLKQKYPEYGKKPFFKFRNLVEQAYRIVSMSYGLDVNENSNNGSDDSDDIELMDDTTGRNAMKTIMNDLYNKPNKTNNDASSKPEAIDISSDDEGDDEPKNEKSAGGGGVQKPMNLGGVKNLITITPISSNSSSKAANDKSNDSANQNSTTGAQKRRDCNRSDPVPAKKYLGQQQQVQRMRENPVVSAIESIRNNLGLRGGGGGGGGSASASGSGVSGSPGMRHPAVKKFKKTVAIHQSNITFQNMGGIDKQLKELCEILIHLKVPDIYYELGVIPPRGILLHGPSGCGKTMLASAIAGQLCLSIITVPATELIAGVSGESEERIREIFEQAKAAAPCVLFIDEIDNISVNRQLAEKGMERRVVSQLISSIDSLRTDTTASDVVLIGATTRPYALDPALRRDGRFDHEIALTIPNRKERKDILKVVCDGMRIDAKLDYDKIAELTPGYVAADLVALSSRAATICVKKKWTEQMHKMQIERKITIVDLDDDIDEGAGGDDGNEKDAVEANGKDDKAKEAPEKEATTNGGGRADGNENGKENENATNENSASTSKAAAATAAAAAEETTASEKITNGEEMDVDDVDGVSKDDENEQTTSVVTAKSSNQSEPTLGEMINWLDTPPEGLLLDEFSISLDDFCEAIKIMQPSAKREGFITVPDVTWDDIGSLRDIREELRLAILAPVKYPEAMASLGLEAPSGVLLCGPPGCGKTLIAKAIANEAGINFISVKGPELMNMYVGESERAVRDCFQRARNSAPCVIFFDEFDSLCPKRSQTNESSSGTRIVNQLLTEMDGIQERKGVYIMAASNRPDIIDAAILRPGRLDSILYVGMPKTEDRHEILLAATKNRKNPMLADDIDLMDVARRTVNYSGADLAGLIRQAAMLALKDAIGGDGTKLTNLCVQKINFDKALELVRPSITEQDRKTYEALRLKYAAPRNIKK